MKNTKIEKLISILKNETITKFDNDFIYEFELKELHGLVKYFQKDNSIQKTEFCEDILKRALKPYLNRIVSGKEARLIANLQKELGFTMKYKPYAIKATSILGYSIFLQNISEGFSFQRHITHKTEIFLILKKKTNGFVFICDYELWEKNYTEESFKSWLTGKSKNKFYDKYKFEPESGDIFIIDTLGVVHTVIGCELIEFATVSTDMVDRLYDQNINKTVPSEYNRSFANQKIKNLIIPKEYKNQSTNSEFLKTRKISPENIVGGKKFSFQKGVFEASMYEFDSKCESELIMHPEFTKTIHVISGTGQIKIGEKDEFLESDLISISIKKGDLLMIPKGIYVKFKNSIESPFIIAEHGIESEIALI